MKCFLLCLFAKIRYIEKKLQICFLFLLLALPSLAYGQLPQIEWQLLYGEPSQDEQLEDVILLPDGGYLAVGYHWDNSLVSYYDVLILRIDAAGGLVWQKSYGGSLNDYMYALTPTTDGGFMLVGSSESNDGDVGSNQGGSDIWVLKIDTNGDLVWSRTYGGSSTDLAFDLTNDNQGGYYITGTTASTDGNVTDNNGINDLWVLKIDDAGSLVWQQTYGGSLSENSRGIVYDAAQSQLIIAGATQSSDFDVSAHFGSFGNDFWILRLQADNGSLLWEKTFGGTSGDAAQDLCLLPDGNFVVVGDILSSDGDVSQHIGQDDWWVIKIAGDTIVWQTTIGGISFDQSHAIVVQSDGSLLVCGNNFDSNITLPNYSYDTRIAKLAGSTGSVVWDGHWGGSQFDFANALLPLPNSRFMMAGTTDSTDGDVGGGGHPCPENPRHGNHNAWLIMFEGAVSDAIYTPAPTNIACYPNPAVDFIYLQWPTDAPSLPDYNAPVSVFGSDGSLVSQQKWDNLNAPLSIPVSSLPVGNYTVYIKTKQGTEYISRFLVKK